MQAHRFTHTLLTFATASILSQIQCHAGPGTLDVTFGTGGKVTTPMVSGSSRILGCALQSDGKIVAAGWATNATDLSDFAIARYNSNGTLDTSFNGTGKVITNLGAQDEAANVVVQPDGKILVAGRTSGSVALARYNLNGSLDTTFNGTGTVITGTARATDFGRSLALQSDGKILVAGYSGSSPDFLVIRYTKTGAIDPTFGTNGLVTTDINGNDQASDLVVQSDGKIVVGGECNYDSSNANFALVRYNANGSVDTTFGTGGKVITDFAGRTEWLRDLELQKDGKIVAAGWTFNGIAHDIAVARYNSDGTLDPDFNGTGTLTTSLVSGNDMAQSLLIQEDGKIVLVGSVSSSSSNDFAIARFTSTGILDTTFNGVGKAATSFGAGTDAAMSALLQTDGKIVMAGFATSGSSATFALARYEGDVYQPDTRIGTAPNPTKGDNVYNANALGQTCNAKLNAGKSKTFYIDIQSDGNQVDSYTMKGTASNSVAKIKYFNGATDVTAAVVQGTFVTPNVTPNSVFTLTAKVTMRSSIPGATRKFLVTATSSALSASMDSAKIKAISNGL